MTFHLLVPPQGPKNCGIEHAIHAFVSNSQTKFGWISEKMNFLTPTPSTPKSHPCGMYQATKWKSRLICYISFICEKALKIGLKTFEIDFII